MFFRKDYLRNSNQLLGNLYNLHVSHTLLPNSLQHNTKNMDSMHKNTIIFHRILPTAKTTLHVRHQPCLLDPKRLNTLPPSSSPRTTHSTRSSKQLLLSHLCFVAEAEPWRSNRTTHDDGQVLHCGLKDVVCCLFTEGIRRNLRPSERLPKCAVNYAERGTQNFEITVEHSTK